MDTVTVWIGPEKMVMHDRSEIDEASINQQVNRRRASGQIVCARVEIQTENVHLGLGTPACPKTPGWREANSEERAVIELWEQRGLNRDNFTGGQLVAFLRQLHCWR